MTATRRLAAIDIASIGLGQPLQARRGKPELLGMLYRRQPLGHSEARAADQEDCQ